MAGHIDVHGHILLEGEGCVDRGRHVNAHRALARAGRRAPSSAMSRKYGSGNADHRSWEIERAPDVGFRCVYERQA